MKFTVKEKHQNILCNLGNLVQNNPIKDGVNEKDKANADTKYPKLRLFKIVREKPITLN